MRVPEVGRMIEDLETVYEGSPSVGGVYRASGGLWGS